LLQQRFSLFRPLAALVAVGAFALIPFGSASASSTTAKRIAYVSGGDLWTIGANGTGTTNLGENPANVSFSSDGQLIVFDDGVDVRSIPASGGASTVRCAGATDPAISPDGTKVAYVSGGAVKIGSLTACVPATDTSFGTGTSPAWAPDGTEIVFVDSDNDIAVAPASGGAAQKLGSTGSVDSEPAWSPDGSKIAFISGTGIAAELFVMNADGSGRVPLTSNAVTEASPSWAPGGDEIVYAVGGSLNAITATGSSTRPLADASGASKPDWGLAVANTVPPTITPEAGGAYAEGTQLSSSTGSWISISGITSTSYQWQRCGSAGTGCTDIAGETGGTYTLTSGDVGSRVRVRVTAATPDGSAPGVSSSTPVITAAPPKNVTPPTISGTPVVAATLTASTGTWSGSNPVFTYQWQKCDAAGNSCVDISGATANVYVPSQGDVGSTIRVVVTGTNSLGSASKTSEATATVASRVPANTVPPTISETVSAFDNTISYTASTGTWTGAATITFRYQWRRCNATNTTTCADIAGAVTSSYTPVTADIGSRLRVAVTATNSFGTATAVSEPSNVLVGTAPANSFPPSISGDAETGSVLTSSNGTWTGSLPITYTYEWRRCNSAGASCSPIPGATSQSYIVQSADAGARIVLAVTAKNSAGTATAVSPPTLVVTVSTTPPTTSVRPNATEAPSFTGVLALGRTLTAGNGRWSGTTPMTFSYQWQRCPATGTACTAISLATRSTYMLVAADVGKRIRLAVTAANAAGATQATSSISKVVAGKSKSSPSGRRINGTARSDKLTGGPGPDTIRGGAGNDRIAGLAGNDTLYGGSGNDQIAPGAGRDKVFGGAGNDTILAADKTRDVIDCGAGSDTVVADKLDVVRGCERIKRG